MPEEFYILQHIAASFNHSTYPWPTWCGTWQQTREGERMQGILLRNEIARDFFCNMGSYELNDRICEIGKDLPDPTYDNCFINIMYEVEEC